MSTTPQTRSYPAAYFLHAPLSHQKTLQKARGASHLLKLRTAFLTGYVAASNSTVARTDFGFSEWDEEPKIKGIIHYVSDESEEKALLDFICEKEDGVVKVNEVDIEVSGGMWKAKEVVRGWVFEKVEGGEMAAELEVYEGRGKQPAEEDPEEDETVGEEEGDILGAGAYEGHPGEDEMKVEKGIGIQEPGDYEEYLSEDEMETATDPIMEPEAYNLFPPKEETTHASALVSSPTLLPRLTSSPARLEQDQTAASTPPPATPQRDTEAQNTTPCAGLESSTPQAPPKDTAKASCDTPGPHIGSTNDRAKGIVKSLVALYELLKT